MADLADIKDTSPNPDLVVKLKELLQQAEAGDIRALVYVVEFKEGDTATGWSIDYRCQPKMIAADLMYLQHDFIAATANGSMLAKMIEGEV